MYTPASFRIDDRTELHQFLQDHPFAALITTKANADTPAADHLPLLVYPDEGPMGAIRGHMARANPHWRNFPCECLSIFAGPHAYISSSWYQEPDMVPTWNYQAVHVRGYCALMTTRDELIAFLKDSLNRFEPEARNASADYTADWDPDHPKMQSLLDAIVGFHIRITSIEGKFKLSQNHPPARQSRLIAALQQSANTPNPPHPLRSAYAAAIAQAMQLRFTEPFPPEPRNT